MYVYIYIYIYIYIHVHVCIYDLCLYIENTNDKNN